MAANCRPGQWLIANGWEFEPDGRKPVTFVAGLLIDGGWKVKLSAVGSSEIARGHAGSVTIMSLAATAFVYQSVLDLPDQLAFLRILDAVGLPSLITSQAI